MERTEPIRILQIVVVMDRGGIETMLMNHYRQIDRSKVQFDFLVHGDKRGVYEEEILALGGRIYRVRAVKTPLDLIRWQQELYTIFKMGLHAVVHAHLEPETRLILRQAKRAGIPVRIAHSHSTRSLRPLLKRLIGKCFEWFVPWEATQFFAASRMAGEWLFGAPICESDRFQVFKNAIDCEAFRFKSETRAQKRAELALENELTLIHVGRFSPEKNHTFLIDILAEIVKQKPDTLLLLVGNGSLEAEIQAKAVSLGLEMNVRFLGSRGDVSELMQAADIFLLPSLYEGLGIVAIEAQTSGLPTLLSSKVPQEAWISPLAESLPLISCQIWAKKIAGLTLPTKREHLAEEVTTQGWDIRKHSEWLQEFYVLGEKK